MFPTKAAGCRPCEVGLARAAVGGVLGVASAVFGGAAKRGRGGGATTGRETGATGAGAALAGAAMGGGAIGTRGAERRD